MLENIVDKPSDRSPRMTLYEASTMHHRGKSTLEGARKSKTKSMSEAPRPRNLSTNSMKTHTIHSSGILFGNGQNGLE